MSNTMTNHPPEVTMHAIYTAFAAVPWLWIGLFALFAVTGVVWMQAPLYLLLMLALGSMPVWLAFTAWRRRAIPGRRARHVTLLAYLLGMAVLLGTLLADPLAMFGG